MATLKEDERNNFELEAIARAALEIERQQQNNISAEPASLVGNPVDLGALPPGLLGKPVHYIPITIPTVDEDEALNH